MNVGLPGAGIGGLYYLICTAIMPFKEIFLTLTQPEHKFRYRLIFTQLGIASAIMIGFIVMYQLVSSIFKDKLSLQIQVENNDFLLGSMLPIISLSLLLFILAVVELLAFFSAKKKMLRIKK